MLRILATALFVLLAFHPNAKAQQAFVVDTCGVLPSNLDVAPTGPAKPTYQDKTGRQCFTGPVTVTTAATSYASTTAPSSNKTITSSPGKKLAGFEVSVDSTLLAVPWWIMIFDATSAPADGAVTPAKCFGVPANTPSKAYGFTYPPTFNNGITIAVSTTDCFNKTESAHAFISGDLQ